MRTIVSGVLAASVVWSLSAVGGTGVEAASIAPPSVTKLFMAAGKAKSEPYPPACPASFDDSPEGNGIYHLGKNSGVTPPKAIHTVEASVSDRARTAVRSGETSETQFVSVLQLVVSKDGMPRDLCVRKSAPYELNEEAAKAVKQYRFEPATKDGVPVLVRISVQIRFAFR